jgi:predicted transcriptional regulator
MAYWPRPGTLEEEVMQALEIQDVRADRVYFHTTGSVLNECGRGNWDRSRVYAALNRLAKKGALIKAEGRGSSDAAWKRVTA